MPRTHIFKATLPNAIIFKKIINVFHCSFKFIVLEVKECGLALRMITEQQHMLFDVLLGTEIFTEFYCKYPIYFNIEASRLYKGISSLKTTDTIILEVFEPEEQTEGAPHIFERFEITTIPALKDYVDNFSISIQNSQIIEIDLPEGYGDPILGSKPKFQKMCKDMNNETVKVRGNGEFIWFSSNLEGIYEKGTTYPCDHSNNRELEIFSDFYYTENFLCVSKMASFGKRLEFCFKKDLPLLFRTVIGHNSHFSVYIKSKNEQVLEE